MLLKSWNYIFNECFVLFCKLVIEFIDGEFLFFCDCNCYEELLIMGCEIYLECIILNVLDIVDFFIYLELMFIWVV